MAMTLWGLSLLGYACAGWLAARRKPGAAAPLLCLLLIPPCLVWAAQGRPAGYEAYGQAARLAIDVYKRQGSRRRPYQQQRQVKGEWPALPRRPPWLAPSGAAAAKGPKG